MNSLFDITEKNIKNILTVAEDICRKVPERLAGTDGEMQTANILFNEIKPYSDEADEEVFYARPSASVAVYKICCAIMIIGMLLFKCGEASGSFAPAFVSSVFMVTAFSLFSYKYILGGKKLDLLFKKRKSKNLFFRRYARSQTLNRVVFVSETDSPRMNALPRKVKAPFTVFLCCLLCSIISFAGVNLFLIFGSPEGNIFFSLLSTLCLLFCVFFAAPFFLFSKKTSVYGASSSIVPSLCLCEIMKELCCNGIRFANTEFCVLLCGSDFLCRDGETRFINKHKNSFRDIPTVFVCLDSVFDGKFTVTHGKKLKYNSDSVCEIVKETADSSAIYMKKNKNLFGMPSFLPFEDAGFDACSLGSGENGKADKNKIKYYGIYSEEQAVSEILEVLKDVLKYYGNEAELTAR